MTDEARPLFAHNEPGPRFTAKDMSQALTRLGLDYPTANARIASYAKHGWIYVREKGAGATSPNKFALADLAAAVLLSAVQDTGMADRSILAKIASGIYGWVEGAKCTTHHPTLAALVESINGEHSWQLQVDFYRDLQTGERKVQAQLYRAGETDPNVYVEPDAVKRIRAEHPNVQIELDPRVDSNAWPVATIQIPAATHLMRLSAFVAQPGN